MFYKLKINTIPYFLILIFPISLLIGTGVSEIFVIIISFFFLGKIIVDKEWHFLNNKLFFLLFILWIYLNFNSFLSTNYLFFDYNLRGIFFIKYIIFIFSFIYFAKNRIKNILCAWSMISMIVIVDIYFEFLIGHNLIGIRSHDPTRIASFLGKELKIGYFILGFCFISLGYFFEIISKNSNKLKLLGLILLFLILLGSFMTGERSNFIRTFFCSIIILCFFGKKYFKYKILFILLAITIILIFVNSSSKLNTRFKGQVYNVIENKGLISAIKQTQHGAHYYTAIEIFKKNIFFGIGNKNFRTECAKEEYHNSEYLRTQERCSTHPHQIYLELLSEHGLVGSFIILYTIFYFLFKNIKLFLRKKNYIHLASIVFITSTFIPVIPSGSFFTSFAATIFWLNFAIMNYYTMNSFKKNKIKII
jgi:O-antigen ligase